MEHQDVEIKKKKRPREDILVAAAFLVVLLLLGGSAFWAWNKYISTPPYVDYERFPVRGIDVSAHNGVLDLDAAARDGISFVFIKATEGESFVDPNFRLNYMKAGHAGLKRGAYHFFRFDRDGMSQALNLLKVLAGRPLELGIAIDVEEQGNPEGIPRDSVVQRLQAFTDFLILNGQRVTFYSNRAGYDKYLFEHFRDYPLWICSFDEENAKAADWAFWQYDHHGKVAGIPGDVDLNVYHNKDLNVNPIRHADPTQ